jgi:hypothetical protein
MLQPVLGNVAIDEGIGHDAREAQKKYQPQNECGGGEQDEESQVLANQFTHAGNIPCFVQFSIRQNVFGFSFGRSKQV